MVNAQPLANLAVLNPSSQGAVDTSNPRWGILSRLVGHEFVATPTLGETWIYKFPVNSDGSIRTNIHGWYIFDTYSADDRTYVNRKLVDESFVEDNGLYVRWTRGTRTVEYAIFYDQSQRLRLVYRDNKHDSNSFSVLLIDRTLQDAKSLSRASFVMGTQAIQQALGAPISDMRALVRGEVETNRVDQSPMFVAGTKQMNLAFKNGDARAAAALLPKLEAVASSEDERFRLGEYMVGVASLTSTDATALRGLTLMAESGKIPLKDMPAFYGRRGSLLAATGKYREADSDLRTAMEMGVRSEAIFRSASAVKEKLGDAAAAQQFASKAGELESARLAEERRLAQLKQEEAARVAAAQKQREQEQRLAAQAPKKSGGGLFGKLMAATGGALAMASGGGGASEIIGGAMAASRMVNGSGDWVPPAAGVNPLTGTGVTGNVNPLISGGGGSATGVAGQSAAGGFATKSNALDSSGACSMMNESNYRQVALSGGNDVQLKTMCGQAFDLYVSYKRAIEQGYSEADCNLTYNAHEKAAANAIAFFNSTRAQ